MNATGSAHQALPAVGLRGLSPAGYLPRRYAALITSGDVHMKRECDNYPDLNHENCILDPYETAVVEHFESQGFTVEKLCIAWLPDGEVVPDFRITDDEGWRCLCEVKKLTSSTGALSESDWKYTNRM